VEVARADHGTRLPAAVDLAAYRIVQEALTNVRKHAGTGARAEVSVVRVGADIEVTVLDDGAGEAAAPEAGGGHGLLGMRERVTALGGTLTTGPRYGGGFRVHAILPVDTHTDTHTDPHTGTGTDRRTETGDGARDETRTTAPGEPV
jgi:signal transduction histidine kinase